MNINEFFDSEHIEFRSVIPSDSVVLRRPDKLEQRGLAVTELKTVIPFLIPYYVPDEGETNISLYARPRDYHLYSSGLSARGEKALSEYYGGKFVCFADNSPIDERRACLMSGLGILGDNGMLINEKYGSYVFLGEFYTDVPCEKLGFTGLCDIKECEHCGACSRGCPMKAEGRECLSAVTQKKGTLTEDEAEYIKRYGSAWGCDICQTVCPHNRKPERSPVEFFGENRIPYLTGEALDSMSDAEFSSRAFSWRGREVPRRNLRLFGI